MEDPDVPSLSDLQVSEPLFIFEPKSVQRMEMIGGKIPADEKKKVEDVVEQAVQWLESNNLKYTRPLGESGD
ncbi:hypothetical protein L2E82_05157 [Cichorium intybus]|uniref:Uncharacterized protein n=1 Tax=Cichorium intybus TaxID=13427 RepID=A0ACB9H6R1_CICIN|nr:hypothetical protein L2E82_05157 [Cichorium intybus]